MSRFGKGGGNWLRCNVGNIAVLNREGEPMDITQGTCKLCARLIHYEESKSYAFGICRRIFSQRQ